MQAATLPLERDPSRPSATPHPSLQIFLLVVAVVELLGSMAAVPILFGDISEIPGPGLGGWTITAVIAINPFVAIAALVFALTGRLRHAIVAIAALGLLDWLNYLPSFVGHGLNFDASYGSLITLNQFFVLPVFCIAGIVFAVRNQRLVLAAAMASVPLLVNILGIVAFGIGVAIYGF
jgi:hypothetical protein